MNKAVVETKEKPSATAEKIAHTPGPWKVAGSPETPEIEGGDKLTLAFVNTSHSISDAMAHANARLIAAAPETKQERDELLSIVRGFVGAWNDWTVERDVREWIETSLKPQIGYARAAIAKAEGK